MSIQMEEKTQSSKRKLREETILNAATEVFVTKGYELSTTKEIAALANCAEGLIFKYFSGKANLLHKILERGVIKAEQELIELPERPDSLEEDLNILIEWFVRIYWNERKIFQIYFAQRLRGERGLAVSEIREKFLKKRRETIFNRLKKHQENGAIRKDIDFENIFMTLNSYSMYICVILPALSPEKSVDVNLNTKNFIYNLVNGLKLE
jgi:AcrR family transcriptional regulator